MFVPDENKIKLPVDVDQVLRLYRSINPVQVALPGLPGQKAGAFICAFAEEGGARVAIALDLHEAGRLYFFFNEQGVLSLTQLDDVIEEAMYFVEAMGYLMVDLELDALAETERGNLWRELPLLEGVKEPMNKAPVADTDACADTTATTATCCGPFADDEMERRRQRLIAHLGRLFAAY